MSRLAGGLLPHKQMPSRRSKNVVQVTANPAKSETKSEKKGEKRFASICHNLPFPSGLRRLRQDLVNLVPRFEGRCSIQLSYGRVGCIDSKSFIASKDKILAVLNFCRKRRCSIVTGRQRTLCNLEQAEALDARSSSCFSTGLCNAFGTIRCSGSGGH